jgi:hypothetical protein
MRILMKKEAYSLIDLTERTEISVQLDYHQRRVDNVMHGSRAVCMLLRAKALMVMGRRVVVSSEENLPL